jgi:hypothetical protein
LPDLSPPKVFLQGYPKNKVHSTWPAAVEDLKTQSHEKIENVP